MSVMSRHLTPSEWSGHQARTQAGMAHWGGEGPPGAQCLTCESLAFEGLKKDGLPKKATCHRGTGVKFNPIQSAYKFYERVSERAVLQRIPQK